LCLCAFVFLCLQKIFQIFLVSIYMISKVLSDQRDKELNKKNEEKAKEGW